MYQRAAGRTWTTSIQHAPELVDSVPLYALFDRGHAFASPARSRFAGNRRPLITNAAVVTEVATRDQRDFSVYRLAHVARLANPAASG